MLKDDLEGIIYHESWGTIGDIAIDRIAQAIIDRLEIDEGKVLNKLVESGLDKKDQTTLQLAHEIAETKPIKIKEGDK